MSLCEPNINPSYHFFTSENLSESPYSSSDVITSFSVKPNESAYISDVAVTTLMYIINFILS